MKQAAAQRILITGGASGIGAAIARLAAGQGHRVVVTDIDAEAAARVAGGIGAPAMAAELDITSDTQWRRALDVAWEQLGGLDVLLSNAAIAWPGYAGEVSMDHHEATMSVNATGPMRGMLAVLPRFRAQGFGHFVTVCSMTAFLPFPGLASYAASKHALRAFHHALAIEESGRNIDFTIVHPTSTETPMLDKEAESGLALAFSGPSVTAQYVAGVVLDAMDRKAAEIFMPEDRETFVKEVGVNLDSLRKLVAAGEAAGRINLARRLAPAAAPAGTQDERA